MTGRQRQHQPAPSLRAGRATPAQAPAGPCLLRLMPPPTSLGPPAGPCQRPNQCPVLQAEPANPNISTRAGGVQLMLLCRAVPSACSCPAPPGAQVGYLQHVGVAQHRPSLQSAPVRTSTDPCPLTDIRTSARRPRLPSSWPHRPALPRHCWGSVVQAPVLPTLAPFVCAWATGDGHRGKRTSAQENPRQWCHRGLSALQCQTTGSVADLQRA